MIGFININFGVWWKKIELKETSFTSMNRIKDESKDRIKIKHTDLELFQGMHDHFCLKKILIYEEKNWKRLGFSNPQIPIRKTRMEYNKTERWNTLSIL